MSTSHDAPPSYEAATSSSFHPEPIRRVSTDGPAARTERNGIPMDRRRSMEDEVRELPPGWVRSFDPESQHQFFVDTKATPPRSIWTHPYDDDEFLATLSPEERKNHSRMKRTVTVDDLMAEDSDDEDHHTAQGKPEPQLTGIHKFSRKLKDKVTGTTHTDREKHRQQRAEHEQQAYLVHLRARQALIRAMQTGQPQLLGKDSQGREVYIESPRSAYASRGPYRNNPYASGLYSNSNMRYMRPVGPYGRPYGYGYGGGAGLPIAAGILGGSLLGAALF